MVLSPYSMIRLNGRAAAPIGRPEGGRESRDTLSSHVRNTLRVPSAVDAFRPRRVTVRSIDLRPADRGTG